MRKKMGTSFIIYVILLLSFIGLYLVNSCSSIKWDLITSNSMEPTLMTNSLVCTDYTIPYEDIEIGDIIRYTEKSITDREIMHRVYQKTDKRSQYGKRRRNTVLQYLFCNQASGQHTAH